MSQCIDAVARRTLLKTVGLSRIGDFTDKCARSEGMSKMCIRIHVIMDERSITLNVGSITFRQCHPLRLQCQMPGNISLSISYSIWSDLLNDRRVQVSGGIIT